MRTLKKYLITDPKFYPDDTPKFAQTLTKALIQYMPDYACFRDKRDGFDKQENLIKFVEICHSFGVKAFLNSNIFEAAKFSFDGVHLPSKMLKNIEETKKNGLMVIASCHDAPEVMQCELSKPDAITLSPLFVSPGKGSPLGLEKFSEIIESTNIDVFALGGILENEQIQAVAKTNAAGFASIRYFVK